MSERCKHKPVYMGWVMGRRIVFNDGLDCNNVPDISLKLSCNHFGIPTHLSIWLQYAAVVFVLLIMEAAITVDILLNRNWEEDFPQDPTGRFEQLIVFVQTNSGLCKLFVLMVGAIQALSIYLALKLQALGPDHRVYDESDDDSVPATLPLFRNHGSNSPRTTNHTFFAKKYSWADWVLDKVFRWQRI